MMKTISIFSDPGHAWAKVSRSELIDLGILDQVSSYSYQRGEYVYLEEDRDLSLYIKKTGANKFKEYFAKKSSKIRNFSPFNPKHAPAHCVPGELVRFSINGPIYELIGLSGNGRDWVIVLIKENGERFQYRASKTRILNAYHAGGRS